VCRALRAGGLEGRQVGGVLYLAVGLYIVGLLFGLRSKSLERPPRYPKTFHFSPGIDPVKHCVQGSTIYNIMSSVFFLCVTHTSGASFALEECVLRTSVPPSVARLGYG
jgi:hypothetical protein